MAGAAPSSAGVRTSVLSKCRKVLRSDGERNVELWMKLKKVFCIVTFSVAHSIGDALASVGRSCRHLNT